MTNRSNALARLTAAAAVLAIATPAAAIPAFARKYGTSCLTCHTIYPKLNPFGEAFRRNGYRFPGVDSDYIKADQIALGQDAYKKSFPNSVWPDEIPAAVPLSIGFNGQALVSPAKNSSFGRAANGAIFSLQNLVQEGHIWAGAALDDTTTVWGEITFANDGTIDVEHAQLLFGDLIGPKHAVNVVVGRGFPTLTQYGPHSSYIGDQLVTTVPVTGIYQGNPDPWTLVDNYDGLEVNGVVAGRLDYSLGVNAGKTLPGQTFATDNFYGHVGYKLGGLRLDGEGATGMPDPLHPWAEDALGVFAFGYQSNSRFAGVGGGVQNDVANVFGLGARGQLGSAELNVGWYAERHDHGTADYAPVTAQVYYAELSYVLYPWMVPVLRVEGSSLHPEGGPTVEDLHVMPGVAFAIRPNVKLVTVFNFERASGFPAGAGGAAQAWQGGASAWGPMQIAPGATSNPSEFDGISIFLAFAM